MLSHHRTPGTGAFWKTPGTAKLGIKAMGLAVKSPCLLPSLVPVHFPSLVTLPEGTEKSLMPCDSCANIFLPSSWLERATGHRCMGPWAFVCDKFSLDAIPCLFYGRSPKGSWILDRSVWQRALGIMPVSRASSGTVALGMQWLSYLPDAALPRTQL